MRKLTKTVETLQVTVKRPNGDIDIVTKSENVRYLGTVKSAQDNMIKATKDAGRGDITKIEIVAHEEPMTDKEIREAIVFDLGCAQENWTEARDRDYQNDIGFHASPKFEDEIKMLEAELAEFDKLHPELKAEIDAQRKAKTEAAIKSVWNN